MSIDSLRMKKYIDLPFFGKMINLLKPYLQILELGPTFWYGLLFVSGHCFFEVLLKITLNLTYLQAYKNLSSPAQLIRALQIELLNISSILNKLHTLAVASCDVTSHAAFLNSFPLNLSMPQFYIYKMGTLNTFYMAYSKYLSILTFTMCSLFHSSMPMFLNSYISLYHLHIPSFPFTTHYESV